jgi:adenylosuccinate synthase
VCVGYRYKGRLLESFPTEPWMLEEVEPEFRTLPGWDESLHGAADPDALPRNFVEYVRVLEDLVEAKVAIVSTGVERGETVLFGDALRGIVDLDKVRAAAGA